MRPFKFLQKNDKYTLGCLNGRYAGQLQWMNMPVGRIYYMETTYDNMIVREEIKTRSIVAYNRYINSYNQFMEMNRDKIIFVYEFVDNTNITNMIHYNQDNFDDMPKDRPLIFRGVIHNDETI